MVKTKNSHQDKKWKSLEDEIISCRLCPRLVNWRQEVAKTRRRAYQDWEYWGRPVPGFGDQDARLLVVGLAPGAHGSNRTGRMFTGDASGDFLYPALYQAGFANQPKATDQKDGLELKDIFISAVCRCVPPANKPNCQEMEICRQYLMAEMQLLDKLKGIIVLGRIAFDNILSIYRQQGCPIAKIAFSHAAFYRLGKDLPWLLVSYHPSRQNTQTGRLTTEMFDRVWDKARRLLD